MRQWLVDAFATRAFRGNGACVVEPFDAWPEDGWMQSLAEENKQAETAFLLKTADPARFGIRWFTPGTEVPLCGHATLAAAHVLFAELGLNAAEIVFESPFAGALRVAPAEGGYRLDFPADPPRRTAVPEGLAAALGAEPVEVWAGAYLIAVMADAATVRGLTPDIGAVNGISGEASGGPGQIVVAAASDDPAYDVVDRFFAPGCGVPEDPATGSAHCILAPLYAGKLGRARVRFFQAYPGRGGDIETETKGDRVVLTGGAVTVLEGRLRV